jgi:membrane protein DedA with SNARE-associated domain
MFEAIVTWLTETILTLGYPGIMLLMAVESSFVPFPSEVILPPAGYLAAQGRMSATLAMLSGLAGSVMGALFNYYIAARFGRPVLHRYGRYLLIKESSLDRAEAFFRQHGEISTFTARLLPVVRQLISVPAGFARMRMDRFLVYTAAGAGIWCVILTLIGWYVGRNAELITNVDALLWNEEVRRYSSLAVLALVPILVVLVGIYIYRHRRRGAAARRRAEAQQGEPGGGAPA